MNSIGTIRANYRLNQAFLWTYVTPGLRHPAKSILSSEVTTHGSTQTPTPVWPRADRAPIVNDFSITVATVNGSGSQTANNTLIRAIHKMGVPASGKNLFPSNIQGLPTWFTIRVSKDGYIARRERAEILVAMNKATIAEDIQKLESGGICLYPIDEPLPVKRDDVTFYPMPVNELTRKSGADAKLRPYVANMVYVGILSCLLDIEMSEIEAALMFHFGGKRKAVDLNLNVVKAACEWSQANLTKTDPFRVERMNKTEGTFLIDGNTASALGAIFGGVQFIAWYPITPATSLADELNEFCRSIAATPMASTPTPSFRPKTNSPRSAW